MRAFGRLDLRSVVIFVETERGRRRDEEPYSCTVTIPDDGIARTSAPAVLESDTSYSTSTGFELNNHTRTLKADNVRSTIKPQR